MTGDKNSQQVQQDKVVESHSTHPHEDLISLLEKNTGIETKILFSNLIRKYRTNLSKKNLIHFGIIFNKKIKYMTPEF
jgi:hypothetical protein